MNQISSTCGPVAYVFRFKPQDRDLANTLNTLVEKTMLEYHLKHSRCPKCRSLAVRDWAFPAPWNPNGDQMKCGDCGWMGVRTELKPMKEITSDQGSTHEASVSGSPVAGPGPGNPGPRYDPLPSPGREEKPANPPGVGGGREGEAFTGILPRSELSPLQEWAAGYLVEQRAYRIDRIPGPPPAYKVLLSWRNPRQGIDSVDSCWTDLDSAIRDVLNRWRQTVER